MTRSDYDNVNKTLLGRKDERRGEHARKKKKRDSWEKKLYTNQLRAISRDDEESD